MLMEFWGPTGPLDKRGKKQADRFNALDDVGAVRTDRSWRAGYPYTIFALVVAVFSTHWVRRFPGTEHDAFGNHTHYSIPACKLFQPSHHSRERHCSALDMPIPR